MDPHRINRTAASLAIIAGTLMAYPALAAEETPRTPSPIVTERRLVVSIPDRKLALIENGDVVSVFAIAVGKATTPSPVGTFTIINRVSHPTYYKAGKVVGPGVANPVGTRWIGLSQKGYGIHGTDTPRSIGFAKSHGCIRLRNQDVEQLFERVRTGDVVELHGERTPELALLFGERRSTNPNVERRTSNEEPAVLSRP
jgi:lipoprotein-anchoring transpeptidase ErfK/SrfK